MCEQTEINYLDGDIVWVKLGACWWPGQVTSLHNLPEDIQAEFRKKPLIAAVKFFQEDSYEFVKNYQQIYKYNCTLKDEFIRKGLDKYRSKSKDGASYMDKFPGDVETAEKLTGGDPEILSQEKFCPEEKPDISALFGEKKIPKKKRDRDDGHRRSDGSETMKKITHPRFLRGESDHEVRIRQQPSSSPSTPTSTGSPQYPCPECDFTSSRVNVIICHIKSHRSDTSLTPLSKIKAYSHSRLSDTSTPKRKYIRKDKSQSKKRKSESKFDLAKRKHPKQSEKVNKKKKTDPELREKLLADWEDESDEEMSLNVNSSVDSSLSSSPTKKQSYIDDNKEFNEEKEDVADNNEIIAETEKLLKETEELSSIHMIQESLDLQASKNLRLSSPDKKSESEKDIKTVGTSNDAFSKSPKKDTSSSDSESKNTFNKDDKKSRLSCFDFDEDDLSEPSIPPVRKIPRVFGEKSLSLKKEIIKEFEMSQAMKNEIKKDAEKISELGRNMELKADEIMEIIQGSEHLQEKRETKANEKSDENMQTKEDKTKIKKLENKAEKKVVSSKNDERKSSTNTCETEVEIVEIFEVEREDGNNDHSSLDLIATKNNEKKSKTITSDISVKTDEASGNKNELLMGTAKVNDSEKTEKTDAEIVSVRSNENICTKEADDTLSERFTTETEDETVSESAETMPEQSENSDIDMIDRSVDDSFSKNLVSQIAVKRGRGRPRKNTKSTNRSGNVDKSPKAKTSRGNKRLRMSENVEIDRKTSDSDTDRSYSGRRRKPNKRYIESNTYVQDSEYRAFKTDESQSESDDKISEKITGKSRRGRRSRGIGRKSEFVTEMTKQEIEIADQVPTVPENNVSSINAKRETPESNVSKAETSVKKLEEKSEKIKCDVFEESKLVDEGAIILDMNVSLKNTEISTLSEAKEKIDLIKQGNDDEEDIKDEENLTIIQQIDIPDKMQTQRNTPKPSIGMLPPKKSQIKKFKLSQIDVPDTDVQTDKTMEAKLESVETDEPIVGPEFKPESQFESENSEEKISKENKTIIKMSVEKVIDETKKLLATGNAEQIPSKSVEVESQSKLDKPHKKEEQTQSTEKILQEAENIQPELKSPKKSSSASENTEETLSSTTKTTTEQLPLTPTRSSMQTRYKGRFTPETGAKGKKDKDLLLEEKPVNTFQEAFLKTLQMDKKKVMIEDETSPKGKKGKKTTKKKIEEIDATVATATRGTKTNESSSNLAASENVPTEISVSDVSIASNLENIEVVAQEKLEVDTKIGDGMFQTTGQLGSLHGELVITSKASLQSPVSENNTKNDADVKKIEETLTISVPTSSLSTSDVNVPVKKREMPRIIENVTLIEPVQILKTKLLDKLPQKSTKHKLEADVTKKGDTKGSSKAKIMKIETLPSNSKVKTSTKSGSASSTHVPLTRKLQVLKTEETDAFIEAQNNAKQNVSTTQTTEKFVQQSSQSLVDMDLDINSMPFVLSEDVLTPESIEQMPVVISSIIPASSSISTTATLSFTPTTPQTAQTAQFKIANEIATETVSSSTKKKSGVPAILKNKKARPTITSVKTLVPPLTGGTKGLKFQSTQPAGKTPPLMTQKGTTPGKYVVVQTAAGQQLRYSVQGKSGTQQKIAIPTGKPVAGNAQVVQQGGKVVILTSAQSCQAKVMPLNISKALGGKVQRIVTSKGQVLCPINPQSSIITSKTIIAPKTDTGGSPTTSKLVTTGHKIINTQGIISSKGMLTPITGTIAKTALLGTLSQGIITKGGIYTPISASALSGKTILGSKTLVTKGTTLLSPQNLAGAKAILTPVSQAISGKATILGTQAIVGRQGTVLTPITGQQVKAIAAKSPTKGNKMQYQSMQKVQLQPILQKSPKVPISSASPQARASSTTLKSPGNTLLLQNSAAGTTTVQKDTPHGKKMIKQTVMQPAVTIQGIASSSSTQQTIAMVSQVQTKSKAATTVSGVQKIIIPRSGSRQTKTQQKIVVQKVQEPTVSTVQAIHAKQTIATSPTTNVSVTGKTVVQSKQAISTNTPKSAKSHALGKVQSQAQKNLLNAMNSISTTTTTKANVVTNLALSPLESVDIEKKTKTDPQLINADQKEQGKANKIQIEKSSDATEKVEEPKITTAQPQIMALPTESGDGTQTYVLVTIDEQGQIQPLDNNTLMSLEGTTQNPDGTRTLYIDPSSLGETGTLDNIVLQFDNGILPNIQTNATTESNQTMISENFSASEIQTSNQDILAAALANTDFQQEISLPENQASSVMTTGLTQTSLINQTILQSTIIPPTEPISSPSVLETSLTLNQPIMTPLEVPSNLPIQSDSTPTSSSVVSTIPSSLELPITITNPSISYISAGETQIQIPGNSMPDIGEIMENPAESAEIDRAEEIPVSTQYLVIPNLEDNVATAETQSVQSAEIAIPSASYSVTMSNRIGLENPQIQTTPSMPIIDDTYTDNAQFVATSIVSEQTFADVPVSEMLVSKAPVSIENVQSQDITVTSEMICSHQVPSSPQKIISVSESKNLNDESVDMMQEVYSSQEVPITSEELILQQPITREASASSSSMMEVTQETESEDNVSGATIASCLPIISETTLVTSESSGIDSVEVNFEVTDSSEIKNASSHEANKLKQLTISERSNDKVHLLVDQQVTATSNEVETISQVLPAESLNQSKDIVMEVDEEAAKKLYVGNTTKRSADCQRDEPTSQEESDERHLHENIELRFKKEEEEERMSTEATSHETPSQSYEQFSSLSITSDSADLPSQSVAKSIESSTEATQSIACKPMETDEKEAEPPTQSFEHSKITEASQSSIEANINIPTQSFNEMMQSQENRPSVDEAIDDQSFPTQSYKVDKDKSILENLEIDAEISQEGNVPSQSNDIGADGIGTSSVSTNNSGLNEDETASSSYVPETPENQERDQEDQESAISTSSYEIPPCEELNIASSSVIPDTSISTEHSIHDNGVPEIPTSSYNLNPDITSTHVDSGPTSSYEDQVIVEQNVSTSYEVPISMPGLDETCSQNFVTESTDHRNEPSSYYAHQEVTASYYESVDQDASSRLEREDPHEEVTPSYYEGNPQEVSQSYFTPAEETPSYTSHGISPSYYDPRPESEASQSYYSTDDLEKTEQSSSSQSIEASQSFYHERSGELRLRQRGEATPTYPEGYPVDYTLENSPIERHDLVESSVPTSRSMER